MHVLSAMLWFKWWLRNHRENCIVINSVQAIELPKVFFKKSGKERIPSVYFKNHQKQLPVPFVIYADFESITEKMGQTVADCFLKGKCTRAFPMGKRKYFNVDCDWTKIQDQTNLGAKFIDNFFSVRKM